MTNLIVNGALDHNVTTGVVTNSSTPGWSAISGSADINRTSPADGRDSTGEGDWISGGSSEIIGGSLTAPLTAGETYSFSADMSFGVNGGSPTDGSLILQDQNGNQLARLDTTSTTQTSESVQFVAPAGVTGIRLVIGPDGDDFVAFDNLQILEVCFARDTLIGTDQGEIAVQDLVPGMMVRTRDNGFQPIRWVGMSPTKDRAVRIKAGAMGNTRDLVVSPRHRMMLDGWQLEMLFDHDQALVTAMELINDDTIVRDEMADVEYYHVMFDQHEVIYAEGAATESFHPDQASMGSMDAAARAEILALFPELRDGSERAQIAPTLNQIHTRYVGDNLDAFVG